MKYSTEKNHKPHERKAALKTAWEPLFPSVSPLSPQHPHTPNALQNLKITAQR